MFVYRLLSRNRAQNRLKIYRRLHNVGRFTSKFFWKLKKFYVDTEKILARVNKNSLLWVYVLLTIGVRQIVFFAIYLSQLEVLCKTNMSQN